MSVKIKYQKRKCPHCRLKAGWVRTVTHGSTVVFKADGTVSARTVLNGPVEFNHCQGCHRDISKCLAVVPAKVHSRRHADFLSKVARECVLDKAHAKKVQRYGYAGKKPEKPPVLFATDVPKCQARKAIKDLQAALDEWNKTL